MTNSKITFLGTGTSTGIPIVACPCKVCQSNNPMNKRSRASIYVEKVNLSFIVDTGPDLRTQLLRENIKNCDFAIITHDHSDHLFGLDDLRPFTFLPHRREIPVFAHPIHIPSITEKFSYIFKRNEIFNETNPYKGGGLPLLNIHSIESFSQFFPQIQLDWTLLPHGTGRTLGLIFDDFSYIIDCHDIPKNAMHKIKANTTNCLIIDCLQINPHPSHLWVEKSFGYIKEISPKKAYLTHMNHELSHEELTKIANKNFSFPVEPAYDGLKIKP